MIEVKGIDEENKIINKKCLHSSVNAVLPWRTEVFFYLSGSRLAMEKIDLHSFEKGLIYKILYKNNNQQDTC